MLYKPTGVGDALLLNELRSVPLLMRVASIHEMPRRGLLGNPVARNWIFMQTGGDLAGWFPTPSTTSNLDDVAVII